MNELWGFFLKKKQFSYLIILAIVALGVSAYISIPKESSPEVKVPIGIVMTVYPGASAEDIEKLVTNKIEDGLNSLDDLNKITSSSREGISVVTVEFQANADLDKSIQKLKDAVDLIKPDLPTDANNPTVTEVNLADQPIMVVSLSAELPATEFANLADNLKDEIKSVSGVSKIELAGERTRQVQVIVDNGRLANYGLSISDVTSALAMMNISLPAGSIIVDDVNYNLKFQGDISNTDQVNNLPILNKNGQTIYVRDVADVFDGVAEATTYSRFSQNGKPSQQAISLSVYKKSGGDITKIGDSIKSRIDELKKTSLKNSQILISSDSAQRIKDDLFHLFRTGLETVALIMVVLFLTLGWREAIVAALSVPLSFLISFIGLNYTGNTINFISLFSLILAIGILVDSGIVVVESIYTRYKKHGDKYLAARETISEYGYPLMAGTMTTVAVFIPLFFLSGIVGKFVASIPYTTIFVLIASIFVALALVPIMTLLIMKDVKSKMEEYQTHYTERFQNWYRAKLGLVLGNRKYQNRFLIGLVLAFFLSFLFPILGLVDTVFFPQADTDYIYLDIEKAKGTTLEKTDLTVRSVEEMLYGDKRIESFITTVGSGSNFNSGSAGSNLANITITLKKDRSQSSSQILESLKPKFAVLNNVKISVLEPNNGPPVGKPVEIKFLGDDLTALDKASNDAMKLLASIKGTREVTSTSQDDLPDFVLTLNRDKAISLGLNSLSVAQTLRSSIYGIAATKIRQDGKDIDVFVKVNLNQTNDPTLKTNETVLDAVNQLTIMTPSGPVLLGSVLDNSLKKGNSLIQHEGRKREVVVSSYLSGGQTAQKVIAEFMKRQKELKLAPGITISTGGETEAMNKTFMEMLQALIFGAMLMMIVLILEFNSFRYAFFVLLTVPLSLTGVMVGLTLFRQAVSFTSILGFIALSGVIVNHTILLIDSIDKFRRRNPDWEIKQVVTEAALTRLRPIILTTITTVIGMVPLIFVNAMWGPLAFTVMFGLSFSLILTLLFVPIIFLRWSGHGKTDTIQPAEFSE